MLTLEGYKLLIPLVESEVRFANALRRPLLF